MKPMLAPLSAATLLLLACTASAQQERFDTTRLSAGMHIITAEVANTDSRRQQGLMFRQSMPGNAGMVFVWDDIDGQCMWMKNTPLPLSVAFIDAEGKIVNIEDMQPQTLESHCSTKPVKYALEMNLGWFAQKNIKPGMKIQGLPGK